MQKVLLLFLVSSLAFSQSKGSPLEDKIYHTIDVFVADPNLGNLQQLAAEEKTFHPETKPEWLALVILKCNKAYYENKFGLTHKAISSYEKAWELYQKNRLSDYDIVESCLQPLGNLYTVTGDFDNAENTIKQYFYTSNATRNAGQKFAAVLNLSNVYQSTGRINEAIHLLETTLRSEKLLPSQAGILWNNLGNNYFLTGMHAAKNAFEQSVRLLQPDPSQSETLSNAYRNLAKIYAERQDFNQANAYMQKAEAKFNSSSGKPPRQEGQFCLDKALFFFMQKKTSEAQREINEVFRLLVPGNAKSKNGLPAENALYAETVLLDALDLQAELFLEQNQAQKALESYQLAFHIEDLLQSVLVYENSKIINQVRDRDRTEKCLVIYESLYVQEKKAGYLEAAFLLAEKTKSGVLKQSLLSSKKQSRQQKLILRQLRDWNSAIVKEQQKAEKADIAKINEAIKKQNQLMLLLKSNPSKKATPKILAINDLYRKLEKDQAVMAEYFFGREKIAVFILENKNIRLRFINNIEAVSGKLQAFISLFGNADKISGNPLAFNNLSNSVYTSLCLPARAASKNLVIIPDGILNFLPFEALVTQKTHVSSFSKMRYLLQDFSIGYSNSADFYLNAASLSTQKQNVLGVFPIFEKTSLELAFSKKELEKLSASYKGKYLEGPHATFEDFKSDATDYSILHLSTHAASGDIYEPATIKFYDREVLYSELYNLELQPDLVVLSACETGIGKIYKAEGAMSIARGFQFAGAENLLFSLWKVNDYTTSVFMGHFYGNLKNGLSYFEANHQAKLDFLADESVPDAKKSPYYWSAFVYYGTLEKKAAGYNLTWFWVFLGLFGVLLLWRLSKKRK